MVGKKEGAGFGALDTATRPQLKMDSPSYSRGSNSIGPCSLRVVNFDDMLTCQVLLSCVLEAFGV